MEKYFSTDVLVDILRRLPPSSRRRARLVCRHWHELVDNRTTEMQSRAKLLIWDTPRGSITVVNLATDDTLSVPPPSRTGQFAGCHDGTRWHEQYSFAYHPITGRYKVVHLPCSSDFVRSFNDVHVFTLGETAWRQVPMGPGGSRSNLTAGIVSIDGMTYWVRVMSSGLAVEVVSFDLGEERVAAAAAAATPLPKPLARDASYHLTEVHGRLGFVQGGHRADVWVLEEGRRWSRSVRHDDVMRVGYRDEGTLVASMMTSSDCFDEGYKTFAYVETKEPLNYYGSS